MTITSSPLLSSLISWWPRVLKHLLRVSDDDQLIRIQFIIIKMANVFVFWLKLTDFKLVMIKSHIFIMCHILFHYKEGAVRLSWAEPHRELTPGNKVFIGHSNHGSIKKKILNLSRINMQPITFTISFAMWRIHRIYLSCPWIESLTSN